MQAYVHKKTQKIEAILKYCQFRNLLTKLLRKSKDGYYREKILAYGQDKSKTWQIINEITNVEVSTFKHDRWDEYNG